ncbi:hypothetical protein WG909_06600 [Peptostreptococcaceae bacterium AGR-M142]
MKKYLRKYRIEISFISVIVLLFMFLFIDLQENINILNAKAYYYDLNYDTQDQIFYNELENAIDEAKKIKKDIDYRLKNKEFKYENLDNTGITFLEEYHLDFYNLGYLTRDKDNVLSVYTFATALEQFDTELKYAKLEENKDKKINEANLKLMLKTIDSIIDEFEEANNYYDDELKNPKNAKKILKKDNITKFAYVYSHMIKSFDKDYESIDIFEEEAE